MINTQLRIEERAVDSLRPYEGNARTHSKRQVTQIADSIRRFGFTNPLLIGDNGVVIAGHGRLLAARQLGLTKVPAVQLDHLSPAERRAYVLADNKLAQNAGWDRDLLALELQGLIDLGFEVELTGFSLAEIDTVLDAANDSDPEAGDAPEDAVPAFRGPAVSTLGDLWELGRHRLLCGDARRPEDYAALMAGEQADLVFTDPPYNVPIAGHVSGLGAVQHREFAFASGEMSADAFTRFLAETLGGMAAVCRPGAIAFVCMDWRHMRELLAAGDQVFSELKQLVVWNKTNGGMGSFYRSKLELVFVWKVGDAPHTNSFELGQTGRYRTNVWDYAGVNSFSAERDEALAMHPTVKPVAMVADALRDCSKRGGIVLDGFGGSGTTLIAAEKCGRRARLIEYDPLYADTIVRRWEALTGKRAVLCATGQSFEDVAHARGVSEPAPVRGRLRGSRFD